MGGGPLDASAVMRDHSFHGGGHGSSGELLILTLDALGHRHGHHVLEDLAVELQDVEHEVFGLLMGLVGGVAFLPEELSGA